MDKRSSSQAGSQSNTGGGDSQGAESGNESQSSYVHTTSGEESVGSSRAGPKKRRRKKTRLPKAAERPKLLQTVVLCYLAALMLRLPVCLGDMHRWVEAGEMPYLRAIREVPAEMRAKLSGEYWISLEPRGGLKKGKLYQAAQETVCAFHDQFGITFPPVNRELLLARFVNDLGLPCRLIHLVKRNAGLIFTNSRNIQRYENTVRSPLPVLCLGEHDQASPLLTLAGIASDGRHHHGYKALLWP